MVMRPDAMMASMPCEMARYDLISDFYLDVVGTEVGSKSTAVALLDLRLIRSTSRCGTGCSRSRQPRTSEAGLE